jgi:hypothetical protein
MKKTLIILFLAGSWLMNSCKKDQELLYNSPDNVYFDFTDSQRDSLLYTFAYEPSRAADTIYLPVRLSGIRTHNDRKFIIKAEPDSSTALPLIHYKPFEDYYIIAADSGEYSVPLIIYNTDSLLQERSVTLKFRLFPTADLGVAIPELIFGKLVFSSKLERPDWWSMWMGDYYSQVKNQLFIIVTGQTTLTTGQQGGLDAPKNLYFVSQLTTFLSDPFTWITQNPDKGYVMDKQPDGSYYFYNTANPAKKIPYRYDAQAGAYFFIDENGNEVH